MEMMRLVEGNKSPQMLVERNKLPQMLNVRPILIVMTAIHAQTTFAERANAKIALIEIPAMTAMSVPTIAVIRPQGAFIPTTRHPVMTAMPARRPIPAQEEHA
jgi:hypothetical protein